VARQPGPLGSHPGFQLADEGSHVPLAQHQALFDGQPVEGALDVEDGVDPADRFERQRCLGDVGQDENPAPGVAPARRLGDRPRFAGWSVEVVEPRIRIGLKDPAIPGEVSARMLAGAVARVDVDRSRRTGSLEVRAAEGTVVTDVGPQPAGHRPALGQHRHRGVVAVDALGRQDMAADQLDQRRQRRGTGTDPVGQGRDAELDAFAGKALALPIERQVKPVFAEQDRRQQAGAGPAAGKRVKRRRRLGDPLARPAAELLADGLDHLPLPGDHLQRLGDILAELDQLALAAGAKRRRRDHHSFARQMRRQRCPHRLAPGEALDRALAGLGRGRFGSAVILARRRLQLFELQLQLVEQPAPLLRRRPEPLTLQLGDQELQMRDHRLGAGGPRLGLEPRRTLGKQRRLQRRNVVGTELGRAAAHRLIESQNQPLDSSKRSGSRAVPQPAHAGRTV
jgi:hypothetical protein